MKSLTEHEIIRILTNQFSGQPGTPLSFDDDVSAIPFSPKTWIIVKTDMLVGSTDVPPGMTIQEAARKAVVATISDFAAKGDSTRYSPRSQPSSTRIPLQDHRRRHKPSR